MTDEALPLDLERLEQELAARRRLFPSDALRERVLDRLRGESRPPQPQGGDWAFAASLAATVLLWLNLSMSATQATDFHLRIDGDKLPIDAVAPEIRQLVPGFSDREVRRKVILLQAGSHIIPRPSLPSDCRRNHREPQGEE